MHPVVRLIQENRELQKVYGSYVTGTLDRLDKGRIYPQFRVNGTVTGRISHSNPNLAQLPKAGGVRGIYIPDPGTVFISADYSQLEVAIEAHLTRDPNLLRIITEGASKHEITAAALGCSRDLAKTINFASQYHCTHKKIAKLAGVSEQEGLKIFNKFWETYAGPKKLKQQTDKEIDAGVVLTTCYGRKRRFAVRKRSEFDGDYRQGYNFKIQSPGADFMSEAFYLTSEELQIKGIGRGIVTIHDEGLIEAKEDYWEEAQALLVKNMEYMATKYKLTVPLKAQPSGKMLRWED
jgi:DNA polymerase-1